MRDIWDKTPTLTRGFALMLAALFLFSLMDSVAKGLTERYPPPMVVWARYASQTAIVFLLLSPWLGTLLRTRYLGLQLLRSALLFGGTLFFFLSFQHLTLSATTAVFNLSPLVITALSVFILKETVGIHRWTGVVIGLIGALIIIRPGSDVFSWQSLLPCCAAVCYAGYTISTRFLGSEESHWTAFLYTALIGTVAASMFLPFVWHPIESATDVLRMSALGTVGACGHLCLILALAQAPASTLAPLGYFSILFNSIWGYALYDEMPDHWTIAGALVIVGAGLYVWQRRQRAERLT